MTKTEKALAEAIEAGNKEKALELFKAFADLKSSTDEQSNAYYEQIEAIGEDTPEEEVVEVEEEAIIDESELSEEDKEQAEEIEEVVEVVKQRGTRGRKPNSIGRDEIEKDFNNLLEKCTQFRQQTKRDNSSDSRLSLRLVRRLNLLKKQLFR